MAHRIWALAEPLFRGDAAFSMRGSIIRTNLCDAMLTGSRVYGVSVWALKANDRTEQKDLIITAPDETAITLGKFITAVPFL
jgi:hypothetical protein